jgi:hypothetical protein
VSVDQRRDWAMEVVGSCRVEPHLGLACLFFPCYFGCRCLPSVEPARPGSKIGRCTRTNSWCWNRCTLGFLLHLSKSTRKVLRVRKKNSCTAFQQALKMQYTCSCCAVIF